MSELLKKYKLLHKKMMKENRHPSVFSRDKYVWIMYRYCWDNNMYYKDGCWDWQVKNLQKTDPVFYKWFEKGNKIVLEPTIRGFFLKTLEKILRVFPKRKTRPYVSLIEEMDINAKRRTAEIEELIKNTNKNHCH